MTAFHWSSSKTTVQDGDAAVIILMTGAWSFGPPANDNVRS
jgi:hypothetical protein